MSYQDDDTQFPEQAKKIRLAKRRFVEKGATDLVNLAMMVGVDPQYLKARADAENWAEVRFQGLIATPSAKVASFEKKMLAEDDPMERHAMVADFLVEMGLDFAKALSSADLKFGQDMQFLRSKIESLRSLSEATQGAVDLARKVRGIEDGTPSAGRVTEATSIRYEVSIGPETAKIA